MATRSAESGRTEEHKLHRDVSTVGLLFVCLGSVIGSGWLFRALYAAHSSRVPLRSSPGCSAPS
jgi:hypothetical protein